MNAEILKEIKMLRLENQSLRGILDQLLSAASEVINPAIEILPDSYTDDLREYDFIAGSAEKVTRNKRLPEAEYPVYVVEAIVTEAMFVGTYVTCVHPDEHKSKMKLCFEKAKNEKIKVNDLLREAGFFRIFPERISF